jgi:methylmalonyl-CoA mutase C-terminal domain/subunit
MAGPIKVLMAKPGFDAHTWGAAVVSMALRDAGMEVIYIGMQEPEYIVEVAVQEDVDVVGLSLLSSTYTKLIPKITRLLREKGAADILIIAGGIFLPDDVDLLKEAGVDEAFLPGAKLEAIVDYVEKNARRKKAPVL